MYKSVRHLLLLTALFASTFARASYEDFRAVNRYNYYSLEKSGQILILIPEEYQDENITIDLVYVNDYLARAFPVNKGSSGLVPFSLSAFEKGIHTLVCSFNINGKWVYATHVEVCILEPQTNEVKMDRYSGGLVVDQLPFYPFGFYTYWPLQQGLAEREAVNGFNMISPYQNINKKDRKKRIAYMDHCAALGIKVHYNLCSLAGGGGVNKDAWKSLSEAEKLSLLEEEISIFRGHPALLAWYIADEPYGNRADTTFLKKAYDLIHDKDPYHPVSMVFMAPSKAGPYIKSCDIIMADPYPVPGGRISSVGEIIKELHDAYYPDKAIWAVPQAFGGNEIWQREPTAKELKAMSWLAVTNGASGIQYFIRHGMNSFPKSVLAWNSCTEAAHYISDLTPYLLNAQRIENILCSNASISYRAWLRNNKLMIVAVNSSENKQKAEFKLNINGLENKINIAYSEEIIPFKGQRFSYDFDALEVAFFFVNPALPGVQQENNTAKCKNLILDPGFEQETSPALPEACYAYSTNMNGSRYFTDKRIYWEGENSLRLINPKEGEGKKLKFFPVELDPECSYTLSVMGRAKKTLYDWSYNHKGFFYRLFHKKKKDGFPEFFMDLKGFPGKTFMMGEGWNEYSLRISNTSKHTLKRSVSLELISQGEACFDMLSLIPDIGLESKTLKKGIEVKIICRDTDEKIYFSTDDTEPGPHSKAYTQPLILTESSTLWVKTYKNGKEKSWRKKSYITNNKDKY